MMEWVVSEPVGRRNGLGLVGPDGDSEDDRRDGEDGSAMSSI